MDGSDALTTPLVLLHSFCRCWQTGKRGERHPTVSGVCLPCHTRTRAHHRLWQFSPMAVPVVVARLVESRDGAGSRFVTSARHIIIRPCRLLHCIVGHHSHGLCPSLFLHAHTPPHSLLTNPSSLSCYLLVTPIPPSHLSPWRIRRQLTMAFKSLSQLAGTS